ncbi:MAG: SpoIIE family protein phosphatase [Firmicutes bacterium]|nr:SpoIIE family protein phosphatase [Bacillota bacterium]MCL1953362.1 SpoIIE family protein phosphatase [Bacillota bacterium]
MNKICTNNVLKISKTCDSFNINPFLLSLFIGLMAFVLCFGQVYDVFPFGLGFLLWSIKKKHCILVSIGYVYGIFCTSFSCTVQVVALLNALIVVVCNKKDNNFLIYISSLFVVFSTLFAAYIDYATVVQLILLSILIFFVWYCFDNVIKYINLNFELVLHKKFEALFCIIALAISCLNMGYGLYWVFSVPILMCLRKKLVGLSWLVGWFFGIITTIYTEDFEFIFLISVIVVVSYSIKDCILKGLAVLIGVLVVDFCFVLNFDSANWIGLIVGIVLFWLINKKFANISIDILHSSSIVEPKYKLEYSIASSSKQSISGDSYLACYMSDGQVGLYLSDGVGSGKYARNCSTNTIRLIHDFKTYKIPTSKALEYANQILYKDVEQYATLDTAFVNLNTGWLELSKSGSVSSFVFRDKKIIEFVSSNLPIGIVSEYNAQVSKFQLQQGDMLLLASDGITQNISQLQIKDILLQHSQSLDNCSRAIVQKVVDNLTVNDDMTVLIVRLAKA